MPEQESPLGIGDLGGLVRRLFEEAQVPVLRTGGVPTLGIRYLRWKRGRGLTVVFDAYDPRSARPRRKRPRPGWITLMIGKPATETGRLRIKPGEVPRGAARVLGAGTLVVSDLDLRAQVFPADWKLPALPACCCPTEHPEVFGAIEQAAQRHLAGSGWRLVKVAPEPVRYKPGSRCVLRYQVRMRNQLEAREIDLELFGKLYSNPERAGRIYEAMLNLYRSGTNGGSGYPVVPRPLQFMGGLGLIISEGVRRDPSDETAGFWTREVPRKQLRLAAAALAHLHCAGTPNGFEGVSDGSDEAVLALGRAALAAELHPGLAPRIDALVARVADRLRSFRSTAVRPVHGAFKPSQLLFARDRALIVDFDRCRLADPALDLGCFIAYLHPGAAWTRRPTAVAWFKQAAAEFVASYRQTMGNLGAGGRAVEGTIERSYAYQASRLFKVAGRRRLRCNSPHVEEQAAICDEIETCLARTVAAE